MLIAAALLFSDDAQLFLITLTLVGGGLLGWKLLTPLVTALARRLEGKPASLVDSAEVAELRARLQELEGQQARVLELEERIDFAERLLAQQRDAARIGPAQ